MTRRAKRADPWPFIETLAQMHMDGEDLDGEAFVLENDDAVDTVHDVIDWARRMVTERGGLTKHTGGRLMSNARKGAPKRHWYVVTGRKAFDDEDSCSVIKAVSDGDATAEFTAELQRLHQIDSASQNERDQIYINSVVRCYGDRKPRQLC